jgi:pyruvate dehydrogenase E2 component (dihydrolipoamide acetyltransferase)
MAKEFKLQDPGEGIHEAEILDILVAEGDAVQEGDDLFRIETDKAAIEIPASFNGVIEAIKVKQGEIAEVGDVLLTYQAETGAGEESSKTQEEKGQQGKGPTSETEQKPESEPEPEPEPELEQPSSHTQPTGKPSTDRPVPAAPSTRRLARELSVNLRDVTGSGPDGRIIAEDVRQAAEGKKAAHAEATTEGKEGKEKPRLAAKATVEWPQAAALPDFAQWGEIERLPLQRIRRTTAKRMFQAWSRIPHVTHGDHADITWLEQFRQMHAATVAEKGGKLTLTVLVLKAAMAALKEFPRFNASLDWETETLIVKHYYHIGVAVDTEQGLLVPVLRNVDRKSIHEIARELGEISERARQGQLERKDMQGGTFTITNPGFIGGDVFTPIINDPEVAILGLGRAALEPVVQGNLEIYEIIPRLRLPLLLAFDHRVINGAEAARFVRRLVELLGDPDKLMLSA